MRNTENNEHKIGKCYRSTYASYWTGLLLKIEYNKSGYPVGLFLIIRDKNNNPLRKRVIKKYSLGWMLDKEIEIDLSDINPDWLKIKNN